MNFKKKKIKISDCPGCKVKQTLDYRISQMVYVGICLCGKEWHEV